VISGLSPTCVRHPRVGSHADIHPLEQRYLEATREAGAPVHLEAARTVITRSRFLGRLIARAPSVLDEVVTSPWAERDKPADAYHKEAMALDHAVVDSALRQWRHREILRICLRETQTGDIREAMVALSDLAAATLEKAFESASLELAPRFGPPPCPWVVMGMGKLGGRELNLSSDIDVIYFYESDEGDETHQWFSRVFERVTRMLSHVTPDGFVFRVDLGLRPEGRSGPVCNSVTAGLRYYEAWGHSWERVAWIRARPVAGDLALGESLLESLEPFVFRRHLDLAALEEVCAMKTEIDRIATHNSERNIKLGPGGIREVEFYTQALQLVHGGRQPNVRDRDTIGGLDRLMVSGIVTHDDRDALASAYLFLRALEHQLQLVDDRQTHDLPHSEEEQRFVASALGYDDWEQVVTELDSHRSAVTARWTHLFEGEQTEVQARRLGDIDAVVDGTADVDALSRLGYGGGDDSQRTLEHFNALRRSIKSPFHPRRRHRERETCRVIAGEMAAVPDTDQAFTLLRQLIRTLRADAPIWSFFRGHPNRLKSLVHLFGSSRFLGRIAAQDPRFLAPLIVGTGDVQIMRRTDEELATTLARRATDDVEGALARLRWHHHAELLRTGFYDIAGALSRAEVEAELTLLAEHVLRAVVDIATSEHVERFGALDGSVAAIGLGRLGAREMTYGSDLDLLFLYEGDREQCTRLCRRIVGGLTLQMATGRLYEVDMRLRPSGSRGPLSVTPTALRRHYEDSAAVWAQQALLRGRFVVGDAALGDAFDGLVNDILDAPRDEHRVHTEVRRVRDRLLSEVAKEGAGAFDLKFGLGGLMEIDLIVQTLRLLGTTQSRAARITHTTDAINALQSMGALSAEEAQSLGDAYNYLRRLESRLRIAHDQPIHRVDIDAADFAHLVRRMGYHDLPGHPARDVLLETYRQHTKAVHALYEQVTGEK
jgi:glutamate-ammonia-ligase adenylyltransferase